MKRIAIIKVMLLVSVLLFSGCAIFSLYMDFGQHNSYRYKEVLTLQSPRPDILDVVAGVAESLGYRVLVLDIGVGHIEMSKKESFLSEFFTGKGARAILVINSMDEGKKLNISLIVSGKRGAGERARGMRILGDFKQLLLERIGQQ